MKTRPSDTIVAIATPLGEGAVSVVRTSGPEAISIVDGVFHGPRRLSVAPGYTITHGRIINDANQVVDEVLASVFRTPHSYTGEDAVEIGCHGGLLVTRLVLETLLRAGARQADPGEFTKRAFLNGKIDLAQAEAVSDLIRAGSERAVRNSLAQLQGSLGDELHILKTELVGICALLELQLDFSEEELPATSASIVKAKLVAARDRIASILSSFGVGKMLRDGVSVAIVGRPNAGKSSLFNRLLMENRAIVSPFPGTTRDFIEETISMQGIRFKLVDTAGIRAPLDGIEADGISRTKEILRSADIILLVLDGTEPKSFPAEFAIVSGEVLEKSRLLVVVNKIDIAGSGMGLSDQCIETSAITGQGIDDLKIAISRAAMKDSREEDLAICSARQYELLRTCLRNLDHGIRSSVAGLTGEFISIDVRSSIDSLSEITGDITSDDILNSIFSKFCIGK